jgi:hypothetical protein
MSATTKQRAALDLYAGLMEEVKVRLSSIDIAIAGRMGLAGPMVREFCFLQLRMLCELIALGCLTAHGDILAGTKLRKEYAADKIVDQLEKLHPHFYPRACTQSTKSPTGFDAVIMTDGFLTKPDLLKLYGKCGDALHRGSLKKLLSLETPTQIHFSDIVSWRQRITTLLNYHAIFLLDNKHMVLCALRNVANNDRVNWVLLESKEALSLLLESK